MSDTKYTPGPWSVFCPDAEFPGIESHKTSISVVIFGYAGEGAGVHGKSRGERKANARLIAAAPDLLDACKDALYVGKSEETIEAVRDRLRKAIAKATGKEIDQ